VRSVFLCAFAAGLVWAGENDARMRAVEEHYNRAQSLQVDFQQSYLVHGRGKRVESGRLSAQKPRRMLWQYRDPDGKFFLTDGKKAYLFSPRLNRVERCELKETSDLRAPVAFLLGRLSFKRDFEDLQFRKTPEGFEVTGFPKRENLQAEKVVLLLSDNNEILRLAITGIDNSVMEFVFSNERMNVAFAESVFKFLQPPGAEIVDVKGFDLQ
jgi:outer membrane lipoprotein carrier protein